MTGNVKHVKKNPLYPDVEVFVEYGGLLLPWVRLKIVLLILIAPNWVMRKYPNDRFVTH